MSDRVLVVLPTYNERATIERVVGRILEADESLDVLVVDDGSPDGTGTVADALANDHPRVAVVHRREKLGLGSAYRAGFAYALHGDWDVVCEMDADLSHDPADLPRLLAALDAGADVAIGSRYVPGGRIEGWPRRRLVLSVAANHYARAMIGLPVHDCTAGFRAYRREVLERIGMGGVRSEGYAFQLELTLRAWQGGFRLVEVPILFTERTEGASKISRGILVEALWRVAAWSWQVRRRRGDPAPATPAGRAVGSPARPGR